MYKVAVINHNDEIYCIINDTFKNYGIETDITCFNDFMNIKMIFDFLFINVDISNLNNIQFIKKYLSIHNNTLVVIIDDNYDSLFNYGNTEKYVFFINQLLDPHHPEAGNFKQRVILSHVGFDRPTVCLLYTSRCV